MQWYTVLWVGIGGFLGANARYLLSQLITQLTTNTGQRIPTATAIVNITGSFLLALFLAYISKRSTFPDGVKLLVGAGFFSAYTTFATYANETIALYNEGYWLTAIIYILGTNILCFIGVFLGLFIANRIF